MSGDDPWLLRKPAQSQELSILLHEMRGCVAAEPKGRAKAKAKTKAKTPKEPKAGAKGRGRGRGQSKGEGHGGDASGRAQQAAMSVLPEADSAAQDANISVEVEGTCVTRPKFFVDCLLGGIRAALLSARRRFGIPMGAKQVEPPSVMGVMGSEEVFYYDHEIPILRKCIQFGILFALQRQVAIEQRLNKRWSSTRPAIQMYAMRACQRVPRTVLRAECCAVRHTYAVCRQHHQS